jgi:hypothetical protein
MARRSSQSQRLVKQVAELAFAAPQVVAQRTARMAGVGASPSRRNQVEFMRMGGEKVEAFYQSWSAMWAAGWSAQFELAKAVSSAAASAFAAASSSTLGVLSAGLSPVHKRAVSNAKRLSRSRR